MSRAHQSLAKPASATLQLWQRWNTTTDLPGTHQEQSDRIMEGNTFWIVSADVHY